MGTQQTFLLLQSSNCKCDEKVLRDSLDLTVCTKGMYARALHRCRQAGTSLVAAC